MPGLSVFVAISMFAEEWRSTSSPSLRMLNAPFGMPCMLAISASRLSSMGERSTAMMASFWVQSGGFVQLPRA